MSSGLPRRSARCLVVDACGRALLLRWIERQSGLPVWFTPGGGVDGAETAAQAARRELVEEVGITVAEVGPLVMHQIVRTGHVLRDEDHFLVRFDGQPGLPMAPDPGTVGWRWWTVAELEASSERFHPDNVGRLLRHVLAGRTDPIQDVREAI